MATGILVAPADGGPYIDLQAGGVRCPSLVTRVPFTYDANKNVNIGFGGTYPGSSMFAFNDDPVWVGPSFGPVLTPGYAMVNTLGVTENLVYGTARASNDRNTGTQGNVHVYQILPVTNANYGITLFNSTDFLSINSAGLVGQCIYKANITTVGSSWTCPQIGNYPRDRYLVFANWDHASYFVDFDAVNKSLSVWYHPGGKTGHAVQGGDLNMNIAVFCDAVAPIPHNGGLNIFNQYGQCTFSTRTTPFMLKGFITAAEYWQSVAGVGRLMVPLCRTGMYREAPDGMSSNGFLYYSYAGMCMAGNQLRASPGMFRYQHTAQYGDPLGGNSAGAVYHTINMPLPVMDANNFFF